MSAPHASQSPGSDKLAAEPAASSAAAEAESEHPEKLPMGTWVTLSMFAVFVIAFGTCASTFLFN